MKRPDEALIMLSTIGSIRSIDVEYRQTGNDTADTFVSIIGMAASCGGRWSDFEEYLSVKVGYCTIAEIKPQYTKQLADWEEYQIEHDKDLKEYERLKAKFES